MSSDLNNIVVNNNSRAKRYEVVVDGALAMIEYGLVDQSIVFTHTEVPKALEGQGIAQKMAQTALEARAQQRMVVPLCPFVAAYIRRHPEYQDLVDPAFRGLIQSQPKQN
jgi:uncharacterized protein